MAGSILWSGCGANNHSSIPIKIDENASKESAATPAKSTLNTLLSKTSDKRIAVYGVQDKAQKDMFSSLDVVINGETKTFNWINVTNPSFYPQISVIDLDSDGENEIVIVLTKATGIGIHNSEVHVLKSDFTELSVSDPKEFVLNNIKVDLKKVKETRQYTVSVDGKLIAELPIQISIGHYLGDAIVRYAFVNGRIEPSKIEFTKEGAGVSFFNVNLHQKSSNFRI